MASRALRNEHDRRDAHKWLDTLPIPSTLSALKGIPRSVEQNKTQRMLIGQIAEQWVGHSKEYIRGYCKLHLGVPILRAENPEFAEAYDKYVKHLPYETKLAYMMEPFDMHVTRLMTTIQTNKYFEAMCQHFAEQGIVLVMPGEFGR